MVASTIMAGLIAGGKGSTFTPVVLLSFAPGFLAFFHLPGFRILQARDQPLGSDGPVAFVQPFGQHIGGNSLADVKSGRHPAAFAQAVPGGRGEGQAQPACRTAAV